MNYVLNSFQVATDVAHLRSSLQQSGRRVWRALEDIGRARAQRHLLDIARQCEGLQPELARELRAASDRAGQA